MLMLAGTIIRPEYCELQPHCNRQVTLNTVHGAAGSRRLQPGWAPVLESTPEFIARQGMPQKRQASQVPQAAGQLVSRSGACVLYVSHLYAPLRSHLAQLAQVSPH